MSIPRLIRLLQKTLDEADLKQLLLEAGVFDEIGSDLRGHSWLEKCQSVVDRLLRTGAIYDESFWTALIITRPRHKTEIDELARQFLSPADVGSQPERPKSVQGEHDVDPRIAPDDLKSTLPRSKTGLGWDVFLAHASPDKAKVAQLFAKLAPRVRTFFDGMLRKGNDWDTPISEALQTSAAVAVLISDAHEDAYYFRAEIQTAIERARRDDDWTRIVPVYLNGWPHRGDSVPYGLNLKQGLACENRTWASAIARELSQIVEELIPHYRLQQVLCLIFASNDELNRFISGLPLVDRFVDNAVQLPDLTVGRSVASRLAVNMLRSTGQIDDEFFDHLRSVSANQQSLIDEVQDLWIPNTKR